MLKMPASVLDDGWACCHYILTQSSPSVSDVQRRATSGRESQEFPVCGRQMARAIYEWEPLCVWHFVWITDLSLGTVAGSKSVVHHFFSSQLSCSGRSAVSVKCKDQKRYVQNFLGGTEIKTNHVILTLSSAPALADGMCVFRGDCGGRSLLWKQW